MLLNVIILGSVYTTTTFISSFLSHIVRLRYLLLQNMDFSWGDDWLASITLLNRLVIISESIIALVGSWIYSRNYASLFIHYFRCIIDNPTSFGVCDFAVV